MIYDERKILKQHLKQLITRGYFVQELRNKIEDLKSRIDMALVHL